MSSACSAKGWKKCPPRSYLLVCAISTITTEPAAVASLVQRVRSSAFCSYPLRNQPDFSKLHALYSAAHTNTIEPTFAYLLSFSLFPACFLLKMLHFSIILALSSYQSTTSSTGSRANTSSFSCYDNDGRTRTDLDRPLDRPRLLLLLRRYVIPVLPPKAFPSRCSCLSFMLGKRGGGVFCSSTLFRPGTA